MVLCLLAPFGKDQKDAQQPLHPGKPEKATPARKPPCAAPCGRFGLQVGERPVLAHPGAIWGPQGPAWQKEKKPPPLPVAEEFGGVILKQVKGPGSPTGVPCRVTSPGRAGRSGIFPRRQFPRFPGSVWRPWGHDRGQKEKISRWQAIFPGVAAGVNERMKKKWQKKT